MSDATIEDRMCALEKRSDAAEKRTQEMMNRILFQQERFDQVLNVHSNMIESTNTIVETFLTKELTLREWFMKQVEDSRKFASQITWRLIVIFCLMVVATLGIDTFIAETGLTIGGF